MKNFILSIYYILILMGIISCDKTEINPGQADSFIKYFGSQDEDLGCEVIPLPDGGYVLGGTINTTDKGKEICLIFTDQFGNSKGSIKTYGGDFEDRIAKMILLPDNGIAMIGSTQRNRSGNKDFDIYIVRTGESGDTLWTKRIGDVNNDEGLGIILNHNNDLLLTGYEEKYGDNSILSKNLWRYSLNLEGNQIWNEKFHSNEDYNYYCNDVVEIDNGYIIMVNQVENNPLTLKSSIVLLYMSFEGVTGTNLTITNSANFFGYMMKKLPDGNLIILGTSGDINNETFNIFLVKKSLDSEGNVGDLAGWPKYLTDDGLTTGKYLRLDENKIHILGTKSKTGNYASLVLLTSDLEGENPETKDFRLIEQLKGDNASIINRTFGFEITSDGGYIITGSSASTTFHESDIVMIKTKPGGNF